MVFLVFTLNTAAALIMGVVLGVERQYGGHPAGLRTNALVSLGSALFVSLSPMLAHLAGPGATIDPSRIASYVVTGIGFLGGGVILREGFAVRGMNTAATLWCSAAIGVLCGLGFILEALIGLAAVLAVNIGMRPLARWIDSKRKLAVDVETGYRLRIVCEERDQALVRVIAMRHINSKAGMNLQGVSTHDCEEPLRVAVVADIFSTQRNDRAMDEIVSRLTIEPGVSAVSWEKKQ
jgi:putative Mg2+ transporter-C (MgtC) family protein